MMERPIWPCRICGKPAEYHHKFSKTDDNIKKYGVFLIHNPRNRIWLCRLHHGSKLTGQMKWSEREFCLAMELHECRFCVGEGISCTNYVKNDNWECRDFDFMADKYYSFHGIDRNMVLEPYSDFKVIEGGTHL